MPTDREKNRFSARAARYARVGANVGGVAARYAGRRLVGGEPNRAGEASALASALGNLKGPLMKVAQLMATIPDLLPPEYAAELQKLQSEAPPMGWAFVRRRMNAELGPDWRSKFKEFEHHPAAAASLGQVHRAKLKDGRDVAVKVQYPGVARTVDQDLKNLKILLKTLGAIARDVMRQKVDVDIIYGELEARLKEELDYYLEARNMTEFGKCFADDTDIIIPQVVKESSSQRVLTMTYIDGYPLMDVLGTLVEEDLRRWVARKCSEFAWRQVLEFGSLHTDFHPGNYLVTYHPKLGVLDFGSIRRFSEPIRKGYLQVAKAILDEDDKSLAAGLIKLGYMDRAQDPAPMVKVIHILFEPMFTKGEFDPTSYDTVKKAQQVGELALENKLYKTPDHGVFLLRALVGMEGIITRLAVKDDYRSIFERCVNRALQK